MRCADGSLYAGFTLDLGKRLACHAAGKASKCTRARLPVVLAGYQAFATARGARQAEWGFKRLARQEKLRRLAAWTGVLGGS